MRIQRGNLIGTRSADFIMGACRTGGQFGSAGIEPASGWLSAVVARRRGT